MRHLARKQIYEIKVTFTDQGSYFYRVNGGELIPIDSGDCILAYEDEVIVLDGLPFTTNYCVTLRDVLNYENEYMFINEGTKQPSWNYKAKVESWLKEVLYYVCVVVLISCMYMIRTDNTGQPKVFAGYSGYIVLSGSMEDVIPKDSFLISKHCDPKSLEIGDDITFMRDAQTVITHRIVGIDENFDNTGKRAFETKGTMNSEKDEEKVIENNVIGKVVFHNYYIGSIILWIRNNWGVVLLWVCIGFGLRKYYVDK